MSVLVQRLNDEYGADVCVTAPTVPYKSQSIWSLATVLVTDAPASDLVVYKDGTEEIISNPSLFPESHDKTMRIDHVEEPIGKERVSPRCLACLLTLSPLLLVHATIMVPQDFIGEMMELCNEHRGIELEYIFVEATDRAVLRYQLPLSEIATEFFSSLKSRYVKSSRVAPNLKPNRCLLYRSKGYASFDYEDAGYAASDLVKVHTQSHFLFHRIDLNISPKQLNLMLNSKPIDALASKSSFFHARVAFAFD